MFLQGNEACLEAAIAAGLNSYAGYHINPSLIVREEAIVEGIKKGVKKNL